MNISVDSMSAATAVWTGVMIALALSSGSPRVIELNEENLDWLIVNATAFPSSDELAHVSAPEVKLVLIPDGPTGPTQPSLVEVYPARDGQGWTVLLMVLKR